MSECSLYDIIKLRDWIALKLFKYYYENKWLYVWMLYEWYY